MGGGKGKLKESIEHKIRETGTYALLSVAECAKLSPLSKR